MIQRPPSSPLFPYTTLFRSRRRTCSPTISRAAPTRLGPSRPRECSSPVRTARTSRPLSDHARSEEHTSELQSRLHLVCRLLLEKKKKLNARITHLVHVRTDT